MEKFITGMVAGVVIVVVVFYVWLAGMAAQCMTANNVKNCEITITYKPIVK